jgi:sulfatase maturation enzyme AslB (radical SAM superfamily)
VEAQRRHLDPAGIAYRNSLQTNLTRLDARTIEMLERLKIGLGVSLDVFGGERVMVSGRDSQDRVLRNLQVLLDSGGTAWRRNHLRPAPQERRADSVNL